MSEPDALLLVSFGGPERPDDVLPFLRNVTRGRDVPDERLAAVAEHYHHFGGRSPINDQNRALVAALQDGLHEAGVHLPVYWGNRNWHPLLGNTMAQIADDGHRRVVALATSAWSSYSGCRQYREDLAQAAAGAKAQLSVCKLRPFHDLPGFIEAQADRVRSALMRLPPDASPRLVFVAHAIPTSMAEASDYVAQVTTASASVAERLGRRFDHDVVWSSRSGPPSVPWTEPDINDHLADLAGDGVDHVVVVPIGFVSDHMEVAWDLDVEAARKAADLDVRLVRAGTVGTHPAFIAGLVDLVIAATDPAAEPPATCGPNCCLRPDSPVLATVPAC